MASTARDKLLIEELERDGGDVHSLVAKEVFKEQLKDVPFEDIKTKYKPLRQLAKGYEFNIETPYTEMYM